MPQIYDMGQTALLPQHDFLSEGSRAEKSDGFGRVFFLMLFIDLLD
jgi:hypothetical protein